MTCLSLPDEHLHPLPFSSNFKAKENHKQQIPMKLMDKKERSITSPHNILHTPQDKQKNIYINTPQLATPLSQVLTQHIHP